MIENFIKT